MVRSGVTKPLPMARPASSNSLVIIRSTSPMPGTSANTGRFAVPGNVSGRIST